MKRGVRVMIIAMWALPTVGGAQTMTRDDLVGTWVSRVYSDPGPATFTAPTVQEHILTLRADNTWTTQRRVDGKEQGRGSSWQWTMKTAMRGARTDSGRWYLAGDSLWFADPTIVPPEFKVTRRGEHLLLGSLGRNGCDSSFGSFRRASTPVPLPTTLPLTLKPADVVGTWVRTANGVERVWKRVSVFTYKRTTITDSLKLQSDSTWMTTVFVTDASGTRSTQRGTWLLVSGDGAMLWRRYKLGVSWLQKIALQGTQLLLYDGVSACDEPSVYERMSP